MKSFTATVIECDGPNETRVVSRLGGPNYRTVGEAYDAAVDEAMGMLNDKSVAVTACLLLVKQRKEVLISELRRTGGARVRIAENAEIEEVEGTSRVSSLFTLKKKKI